MHHSTHEFVYYWPVEQTRGFRSPAQRVEKIPTGSIAIHIASSHLCEALFGWYGGGGFPRCGYMCLGQSTLNIAFLIEKFSLLAIWLFHSAVVISNPIFSVLNRFWAVLALLVLELGGGARAKYHIFYLFLLQVLGLVFALLWQGALDRHTHRMKRLLYICNERPDWTAVVHVKELYWLDDSVPVLFADWTAVVHVKELYWLDDSYACNGYSDWTSWTVCEMCRRWCESYFVCLCVTLRDCVYLL